MNLVVTEKFTGEKIQQLQLKDEKSFAEINDNIRKAFEFYKNSSSAVRKNILYGISQLIAAQKQEIADLISRESAKPMKYSLGEVDRAIYTFKLAAEECDKFDGQHLMLDGFLPNVEKEALVRYFPSGAVYGITPFNFPLNLVAHKVAPAIAVGAPIVIKPDLRTPLSALKLQNIALEAGLPLVCFQVALWKNETAENFLQYGEIKILSFTGSPKVGWHLKSKSGKKKVLLELGGNAGVIVTPSCTVDKIVSSLVNGMIAYSGQVCIHTQRVIVHESIYDELKTKLIEAYNGLKFGNPTDPQTDVSVMIDEENAKRVEQWVNEALEDGAVLLTGGKRNGAFYEPAILENVNPDCKVYCEEVFGPVAILQKYDDFKEAVDFINQSKYGLQAGIFTDNWHEAMYAFEHIECGGIILNDVPTYRSDRMPYGGMKDSGLGREGIRYAMMEYCEPKVLVWPRIS